MVLSLPMHSFFFFNDTATTEIYTLSLHDALPICGAFFVFTAVSSMCEVSCPARASRPRRDRKSTRLNSSHGYISYAVFCLKKKMPAGLDGDGCRLAVGFDRHCEVHVRSVCRCRES